MRVILHAQFQAKPGHLEEVKRLISDLAQEVRRDPGTVEFSVYRERENPLAFFVFEIYRDQRAFEDHLKSKASQDFNRAITPLIETPETQLTMLEDL